MNKYWHVIKIGIQNTLVYRTNFLFRAGFSLVPLMATILLWRTIYAQSSGMVGSYTLDGMISYYLLITIVDALTAVNEDDWQIASDIKDGNISQFLLKPIDYMSYRLCLFFFRANSVHGFVCSAGRLVHLLLEGTVDSPAGPAHVWLVSNLDSFGGNAPVYDVLHHGAPGFLAAGGLDGDLYRLCL